MFTKQNAIDEGWIHYPGYQDGYEDAVAGRFNQTPFCTGDYRHAYDRGYQVGQQERMALYRLASVG